MSETKKSVFEVLSKVDVSNHIDLIKMKKGPELKYVSWAFAWSMLKSKYPDTPTPTFKRFPEMVLTTKQEAYKIKSYGKEYTRYRTVVTNFQITNREVPYLTTTTGTMVECTIKVNGTDYSESLYVMDNANNAVINPTMQQIYKTQKRCLVKALAMAGLGLNLYAGEDLPMGDISESDKQREEAKEQAKKQEIKSRLDKALKVLADEQGTTATEVKAALIDQYKNERAYKENPDLALLGGATAMYRQLQKENQKAV
ncbi:Sak single strand annealing protein [Limosilactobacillus vaginalis]|uniref:Sak single strand annealing protein n=1 Tax=Limosilactobacillus vaginalis TaxID=1633 RepID=UPI002358F246|nr:DUF1071 domain-containing protein [Limosilactobacillus vaginalis]WCT58846.1 DUF1071 domain-containing protein [Limosilactobacillus vaginalis]